MLTSVRNVSMSRRQRYMVVRCWQTTVESTVSAAAENAGDDKAVDDCQRGRSPCFRRRKASRPANRLQRWVTPAVRKLTACPKQDHFHPQSPSSNTSAQTFAVSRAYLPPMKAFCGRGRSPRTVALGGDRHWLHCQTALDTATQTVAFVDPKNDVTPDYAVTPVTERRRRATTGGRYWKQRCRQRRSPRSALDRYRRSDRRSAESQTSNIFSKIVIRLNSQNDHQSREPKASRSGASARSRVFDGVRAATSAYPEGDSHGMSIVLSPRMPGISLHKRSFK